MMPALQEIHHRGTLAAVVVGDQALIRPTVTAADIVDVEAKCLYAIEINAGERPGPYSDDAAARYAKASAGLRELPS